MNFFIFFIFFEVDATGVCAAICLGVDAPQATPSNPRAGGGHIARRRSFCCCATRYWSLSWLDWRLGVHTITIGGAAIFRLRLNASPFEGLPTEPDVAS